VYASWQLLKSRRTAHRFDGWVTDVTGDIAATIQNVGAGSDRYLRFHRPNPCPWAGDAQRRGAPWQCCYYASFRPAGIQLQAFEILGDEADDAGMASDP
jgi:hypothetical protein